MIVDAVTSPRISAAIDWEFSSTEGTSSLSQYPLFIVNHPAWELDSEDDHSLPQRNIRDQATFTSLMREAERKKDSTGDLPLSHAFSTCHGLYLFEQCMISDIMYSGLYPELFSHIHGDGGGFLAEYYRTLQKDILRKSAQQFKVETEVWNEVFNTLGSELVSMDMNRSEFHIIVQNHVDRFREEGW